MKLALKWSIIIAIAILVWMSIEEVLGFHDARLDYHQTIMSVFGVPLFILIWLAMRDFVKTQATLRIRAIGGFLLNLIGFNLLWTPLVQWVFHNIISPQFLPNSAAHFVEIGYYDGMPESMAFFTYVNYIWFGMGVIFATTLVFGAIAAAFFYWRRPKV